MRIDFTFLRLPFPESHIPRCLSLSLLYCRCHCSCPTKFFLTLPAFTAARAPLRFDLTSRYDMCGSSKSVRRPFLRSIDQSFSLAHFLPVPCPFPVQHQQHQQSYLG